MLKKVLKVLAILIGAIVLIGILGFSVISYRGIPSYEVKTIDHEVISTPESVARGKKLVSMLCANCHRNPETGKLTGTKMLDAPPEFGTLYTPNITQDKTYGIGEWTDGELIYLLRTGIKRDGVYAPPYMAKLPNMADSDVDAIISFLRSDDPMVAADPTADQPCQPSFLTKFLCTVAFEPLPYPEATIELPDTNNRVEWGRYLVHNLDCYTCHSADFKTINFMEPTSTPGYMGGGNVPLNKKGQIVVTANLTPDPETGIGNWTGEQFVKAVKYGIKDGEAALQYPMVPYTQLTDSEALAIFEYLKTVPPIENKVERTIYE